MASRKSRRRTNTRRPLQGPPLLSSPYPSSPHRFGLLSETRLSYNKPVSPHQKGSSALEKRVDLERIKKLRIISIVIMGIVTGILSGLLGVGGGFVLVPMMVYLLGMNQHRAHGTSLAVISMVVLFSAIFYSRHGQVDWTVAIQLAIGGVIGATVGARLCTLISARRLSRWFGVLLILVGLRMLYGAASAAYVVSPAIAGHAISPHEFCGGFAVVGIGLATGVLSGIFGIGGGIVMIPAMVLLLGYTQKMAQGISLAVIIPVSISGALIHNKHGNVRWDTVLWLGLGGIIGGLIGARIAVLEVSDLALRGMFGILTLIVGILMTRRRTAA